MEISRNDDHSLTVLSLHGRLDHASADALQAAASQAIDEGCRILIIEMTGVDFIASVGIRALIRPSQAIAKLGGKLSVTDLKPQMRDFFKLTGLDQMFIVHDSVANARAALAS
jgi:anti-sigma B factor antagonist